jgi:hypothetical protein
VQLAVALATLFGGFGEAFWSVSGEKRTLRERRKLVVADPKRHFTTINYCTAKGSFDHLVGSAKQGQR